MILRQQALVASQSPSRPRDVTITHHHPTPPNTRFGPTRHPSLVLSETPDLIQNTQHHTRPALKPHRQVQPRRSLIGTPEGRTTLHSPPRLWPSTHNTYLWGDGHAARSAPPRRSLATTHARTRLLVRSQPLLQHHHISPRVYRESTCTAHFPSELTKKKNHRRKTSNMRRKKKNMTAKRKTPTRSRHEQPLHSMPITGGRHHRHCNKSIRITRSAAPIHPTGTTTIANYRSIFPAPTSRAPDPASTLLVATAAAAAAARASPASSSSSSPWLLP